MDHQLLDGDVAQGSSITFFDALWIGSMRLIALKGFKTVADPARSNQAENDDGECCGETTGESSCFFQSVEHKGNGDQNTEDSSERSTEGPDQVTDRAALNSIRVDADMATGENTGNAQNDDQSQSLPRGISRCCFAGSLHFMHHRGCCSKEAARAKTDAAPPLRRCFQAIAQPAQQDQEDAADRHVCEQRQIQIDGVANPGAQ